MHSNQSGSRLLLLLAIADYANADGWAWPSVSSLCQRTRLGERYVQKMLRELQEEGELEIKEREGKSSFYRVLGVNSGSPVHPGSLGVNGGSSQGVNPDAPKPPVNHQEPPPPKGGVRGKKKASALKFDEDTSIAFGEFWAIWPHKVAKVEAEQAFLKGRIFEKIEVVLAAVEAHKKTDQWQRGIIPHPATWLNGKRWEDNLANETRRTQDHRSTPAGGTGPRGGETNRSRAQRDLSGVGRVH